MMGIIETDKICERKFIRTDGVLTARAVIEYPQIKAQTTDGAGESAFNAFFKDAALRCLRWADGTLRKIAEEEYNADSDDRKRFHFKPLCYTVAYSFDESKSGNESEETLITITASLYGGKFNSKEIYQTKWKSDGSSLLPNANNKSCKIHSKKP